MARKWCRKAHGLGKDKKDKKDKKDREDYDGAGRNKKSGTIRMGLYRLKAISGESLWD